MFSKTIDSLGVELECGISNQKLQYLSRKYSPTHRYEVHSDGSVSVNPHASNWVPNAEITYNSDRKADLYEFFEDAFRDNERLGALTNRTTGMHCHIHSNVSFMWQWSYAVTVHRFLAAYKSQYHDIPKYMNRLVNEYSKGRYSESAAVDQIRLNFKNSARRYAVNLNAYSINPSRGTFEIRILPGMDNAAEAIKSIEWLTKTIDDINLHPNKTIVFKRESSNKIPRAPASEFSEFANSLKSELERAGIRVKNRGDTH
jgi:hypothetical protein